MAPDDGAAAAACACRTLRVAAQYIQYRQERAEVPPAQPDLVDAEMANGVESIEIVGPEAHGAGPASTKRGRVVGRPTPGGASVSLQPGYAAPPAHGG